MVSAPFLLGVAMWLATLYAIRRWIGAMAPRLWAIARDELAKARDEDAAKEQKALKEAADRRVSALLLSLRQYQDGVEAQYRKLVADAQARARVPEPRAEATDCRVEQAAGTPSATAEQRRATEEGQSPPGRAVDEGKSDDADEPTKVFRGTEPLRVPVRRPPPVPRAPLPPAAEQGERVEGERDAKARPTPSASEKK